MAASDDDCDLDTLSALLEEESNDSTHISNHNNASHSSHCLPHSSASSNISQGNSVENQTPVNNSGNDQHANNIPNEDEEALMSMLEADSDLEDETALMDDNRRSSTVNDSSSNLQNAEHDDVDMAALSSMLEQDSDMEDGPQEDGHAGDGNNAANCEPPKQVKKLQDELAMMQQRMIEIQQLLASQAAATTATASPRPVSLSPDTKTQQAATTTATVSLRPASHSTDIKRKPQQAATTTATVSLRPASHSTDIKRKPQQAATTTATVSLRPASHSTDIKRKPQQAATTTATVSLRPASHSTDIKRKPQQAATFTETASLQPASHSTNVKTKPQQSRLKGSVGDGLGTSSGKARSSKGLSTALPSSSSSLSSASSTRSAPPSCSSSRKVTSSQHSSAAVSSSRCRSDRKSLLGNGSPGCTPGSRTPSTADSATKNCASRLQPDTSPSSALPQPASIDTSKNGTHKKNGNAFSKAVTEKKTGVAKGGSVERKNGSQTDETKGSSDGKGRLSSFLSDTAGSSGDGVVHREAMKRALFGDGDSDSDWDDLDGEKGTLSQAGQQIKRLITQQSQQRQAHTPAYPSHAESATSSAGAATSWKAKPEAAYMQKTSPMLNQAKPSPCTSNGRETEDKDCMTEKFSGLRIKNPKISSIMIGAKMEGRRMIAVSRLHLKVKSPELQSDWVTIGVIVHKSDARKSQTGKTYSIWKLSDLQEADTTVSFFLFGQVYKQLWKMDVGCVIGLLNPSIMDPIEKSPEEVAFTVSNAAQVMEIGQSRDLGWCLGKTKRGTTCTNFINKKFGDFCTYHVQAAYRKQSAKRSELHGSCPGTAPKSSLKQKLLQNNTFFYGGETFTSAHGKGGGSKKDKVTLAKLQSQLTQQDRRKVTTLSVQDLLPTDRAKVATKMASELEQPFLNLLAVPSAGSMNLVHHMAQNEGLVETPKDGRKTTATFHSIKPVDLLKQHRQQVAERVNQRKQEKKAASQESRAAPVLGKGLNPGSKIDLFVDTPPVRTRHKPSSSDAAKKKAIEKVQAKGGLDKVDPNAVRKTTLDTDKVRKRVLENIENDGGRGKDAAGHSPNSEPASKRSRLLGNVDPNSEEVRQLLKARSSHTGALAQAEADREEHYFDRLEKKEMMEEKMKSITSMEVTVYTCAQCKYTAMSLGERCKHERHAVRKHKGKRRYFACKECKHRTVSLQRYPAASCKKCGGNSFEKTSMHQEKAGPKLESETLCLRGDESKFINAMEQKVFMTTFEQD